MVGNAQYLTKLALNPLKLRTGFRFTSPISLPHLRHLTFALEHDAMESFYRQLKAPILEEVHLEGTWGGSRPFVPPRSDGAHIPPWASVVKVYINSDDVRYMPNVIDMVFPSMKELHIVQNAEGFMDEFAAFIHGDTRTDAPLPNLELQLISVSGRVGNWGNFCEALTPYAHGRKFDSAFPDLKLEIMSDEAFDPDIADGISVLAGFLKQLTWNGQVIEHSVPSFADDGPPADLDETVSGEWFPD